MDTDLGTRQAPSWQTIAILAARLIFGGLFLMTAGTKFFGIETTATYIAAAGFPIPTLLAWAAAFFEAALALCLLTGAFFAEAALLAGIYILFLAFSFHGPARWEANPMEIGFFIDHFTFFAGLLFAAVHGSGRVWALRRTIIGRY